MKGQCTSAWCTEQSLCLGKLSGFFPYPSPKYFGRCHMIVLQNLKLSKTSSWEVNGNISFHSKGKQLLWCFCNWAENLERNLKLKKAKNSKRFIFWTVVSVALAQGKICSWEKGLPGARFFSTLTFLVGVALNQYVSVKAISSQIEIFCMDCIIAVYNWNNHLYCVF